MLEPQGHAPTGRPPRRDAPRRRPTRGGPSAADVLEDAPCGYLAMDDDGVLRHANPTFLAWTGYGLPDLRGKRLRDLLGPGSRIYHETHIAPLLAVQGTVRELMLDVRRKDGSTLPTLVNIVRRGDGAQLAILFEVTERRHYERELLQARRRAERGRERMELLAHAGARLAASLDHAATVQAVANAALAFAPGAILHLPGEAGLARVAAVHRDVEAAHRLAATDPAAPHAGQVPETPRRGTIAIGVHATAYLAVPMLRAGHPAGALTFLWEGRLEDVDPQDVATAEEFGRLASLALDNARLMAESTRAVRTRDELMGIAGHEFRTPVGALLLQFAALRQRIVRGDPDACSPERVGRLLDVGSRQLERLVRLVDDVLEYARLQAGRLRIERGPVDLRQLVYDVLERMEENLRGVAVHVMAPEPVVGDWDRLRLEQVFTNLLTNAVKYGAGKPVAITVARHGAHAVLEVEDQGVGIPREDQHRIFDRFERLEATRYQRGLGLGLHIVREIVRGHGGAIEVESEEGAGSTFRVTLPLEAPAGPARMPA